MIRPSDKHLDADELDGLILLGAAGRSDPTRLSDRNLGEAQRHVESCQDCNRKLQMHEWAQIGISHIGPAGPAPPGPSCIADEEWLKVAAGMISEARTRELMKHAAQCGHCGPLLRTATAVLADEASPQEEATLAASHRPEWRKQMAERLRRTIPAPSLPPHAVSWWPRFATLPRLAGASTALAALILAGWLGLRWMRPPSAEQLLAQAYTEHRTLEMRIPGASYARVRVARINSTSSFDKPPALLRAETLIAEHLAKQPGDPAWLQAKSRADMLDGNYDSAIQSLERALELEPDSPSLWRDLGAAYYQHGQANDKSSDYANAIDYLSKALAKSPDDPVALFNRAIVFERAILYTQAIADWQHYLRVETNPEWAGEARARLAALEEKVREHSRRLDQPLLTPEAFVQAMESGREDLARQIDHTIERYQNLAMEEWVALDLMPRSTADASRAATRQALNLLAADLRDRHDDQWLDDFLAALRAHGSLRGLNLLLATQQAATAGNHVKALALAAEAAAQFESEGNQAGVLRARFQSVYAHHLSAHGEQCHQGAKELLPLVRERRYSWLEVQTLLEAAACAAEISLVDESTASAVEALRMAKSRGYESLELRATVFVAGLLEDVEQSFQYLSQGLALYWRGDSDPMRGYSLLAVMDTTADQLRLWFFDEAVIKEALAVLGQDPDFGIRGFETYRLARAQVMSGEVEQAEQDFRQARQLLDSSASPDLVVDVSIYLAESYVQTNRYAEALDVLRPIEGQISGMSHDILRGKFYAARAAALLASGQDYEARESILPAIEIAERGLGSISSERQRFDWFATYRPVYRAFVQLRFPDNPEASFQWWEAFKGASLRKPVPTTLSRSFVEQPDPEMPLFPSWRARGTTLISYAVSPDEVLVWSFDGQEIHSASLKISNTDFVSELRAFSEACADPGSDPAVLAHQGHELYEWLIRPVEKWLPGSSHLIFETDGPLDDIPFEALVTDQGKFLSDSYDVSYSPGLFYLGAGHAALQVGSGSRVLIAGDPLPGNSGLLALPDALDESREIAKLFESPRVLSRREATRSAVLRFLPRSEVFHFAGHTTAGGKSAGLVLAADGDDSRMQVLTAAHLDSNVLAKSRLVVLSACSTLHGVRGSLSDRDSLVRTLLGAGVPQVVASRWPVDSAATTQWMEVFYQHLLSGHTVSAAARASMANLRGRPQWAHPFYWASFSAFGK